MKKIAFYLPQYHCIPENDEWWGNGFTEWTNVKKSKPLFKGHNQPEIPLHNNYYNLLDVDVMIQQAELAKKYGIYGFCYYHYWFEGKLLLQKPLENMLNNSKVNMPFCLCWANETWSRTWDGGENDILIKQNYSENENEWKDHFRYLLDFFRDDRYIKVNNKPMLILYKPHLIKNIGAFIAYWNNMAIESGFSGIFFGYQHHSVFKHKEVTDLFDFGIEFEPWYTVNERDKGGTFERFSSRVRRKILGGPTIYDYDRIWKRIINRCPKNNNIMPGTFTAWDNTPRREKNGDVFYKSTPEKFGKYFKEQVKRAKLVYKSDFIFINAWNEWAEGAHLEPDEVNGYGYLEAILEEEKRHEK